MILGDFDDKPAGESFVEWLAAAKPDNPKFSDVHFSGPLA